MQPDAKASVYLGDRKVGLLGYSRGNTWFEYTDLVPGHPVLGQGFERDPRKPRRASGSVPEWFANLLPEPGSGLREMVAVELGRKRLHDFPLLVHLGEDLPGAVRVVPDVALDELPDHPESQECTHDHPLRFSLAGVQAKFSMRHEGKALVLPATGSGGDWIVKLPDRRFPEVPRNEYAMLRWAGLAGLDVPETLLATGAELRGLPRHMIRDEEYAFAVRRFDRTSEGRVHQEDFAQVREVAADSKYDRATYEGAGRVVRAVCPAEDFMEYIRRLAAIVVMGNVDAHLKNWTLRYPDGRTARLSPAYDLVCVSAYPEVDQTLAFPLGGVTSASRVTSDSFRRLADTLRADPEQVAQTARETAEALASCWAQVKRDCPVPDFVSDHLDERLGALALLRR